MIRIPCPWCGARNSNEFRALGEAKRRPDVTTAGPEEWRTYLYTKANLADWVTETWYHRSGCRRYFTVERHTVTNDIRASRVPAAQARHREGTAGT